MSTARAGLVLVAHEAEGIRAIMRRLVEEAGYRAVSVAGGRAALEALEAAPDAMVIDVALPEVLAFEVVAAARRVSPETRVVLVASVYNRTGYKRTPTSLYGADDYIEQHHLPDKLVDKLARLIGPPPHAPVPPAPHADTPEGRSIRTDGEGRLQPLDAAAAPAQLVERAVRLARLIVADIALYNGDAFDGRAPDELEARLRTDLDEGRLLFDMRVPARVRRTRDFIGEALEELRQRRASGSG
jgi:CheY-like chemotaxis protein